MMKMIEYHPSYFFRRNNLECGETVLDIIKATGPARLDTTMQDTYEHVPRSMQFQTSLSKNIQRILESYHTMNQRNALPRSPAITLNMHDFKNISPRIHALEIAFREELQSLNMEHRVLYSIPPSHMRLRGVVITGLLRMLASINIPINRRIKDTVVSEAKVRVSHL